MSAADQPFDVFVSHAFGSEPDRRWHDVQRALVNAIQERLRYVLGRDFRLFFDDQYAPLADDQKRDRIRLARRAQQLVILASRDWSTSDHARREVFEFLSAQSEQASIVVAEIQPIGELNRFPRELARFPKFVFWEGRPEEPRPIDAISEQFTWQTTKICDAIAISLLGGAVPSKESGAAAPVASPSQPPPHDRYRTQTDDPARIDALERGPFAAVLAARIREVRQGYRVVEEGRQRAFMVHLHGPWGSGKSSMLSLIQRELETRTAGAEPSLVVWFNAWKHQRMRPPWWALLNTIYEAAVTRCYDMGEESERNTQRWALKRLWWRWRLRTEWVPILLIALLLGGLMFALLTGISLGTLETPLKIIGALITAGAGVYTYARLMVFGSGKAAQTYAELKTDPYGPVVRLFNRLVGTIRPPLVVFVDDIDRCDSDYVVELLEGIQTLFRDAHVTYIIAADRKWICSSFEKRYGDFAGPIGEPGRPLGHLFLDKMFQISVGLPRLTPAIQARYLAGLLAEGDPAATAPSASVARAAAARVDGIVDEGGLQQAIAESEGGTIAEQRAVRAAAALQITSVAAAAATEHRLHKFAHLLEPNPRSMKRLVNAVGMAQARGILEGRLAAPETRARWVMLTLRWPILAEFIEANPEAIRHWTPGTPPIDAKAVDWPPPIRELIGNRAVMAVVGEDGGEGSLTPENLAPLLG